MSEAAAAIEPVAGAGLLPAARTFFRRNPTAARLGVVVLVLILWELAGHTILDPSFLSPPSAIIAAMPRVLGEPGVQAALEATFVELVVAFALAVIIGVAVAVPIGLGGFTRRVTLPLILLLYSIPQVTILPLFVLYFGIGAGSKIAFGVSHGIFPIILNVVAGVQSVEAAHLVAARAMGASRLQTIHRVVLPHMTPSLFTGLRLAMSGTLLGVLLAELYVSTGGVGYYARIFADSFDPPATFTLVTMLALMAVVLNETVRVAERRASFWRAHRQ